MDNTEKLSYESWKKSLEESEKQFRYSLPNFKVALVREGAIFEKNHEDDAAYDVKVFAREIKDKYIKYMLGIKTEIPVGYVARIWHRSSNSDKDGIIANLVGTIDAGFRGEWQARVKVLPHPRLEEVEGKIQFVDFSKPENNKHLEAILKQNAEGFQVWENGEKALQVTFHKILEHTLEFVDEFKLSDSERGDKGHGSSGTGKNIDGWKMGDVDVSKPYNPDLIKDL